MVVCVCNAIREGEVRCAARDGARSPGKAYATLGKRLKCGQCVPYCRDIIRAERAIAC